MSTIKTKLGLGENARLWRFEPTGTVTQTNVQKAIEQVAAAGGSPGGSTTQVQFNNSGGFGGNAGLTYTAGGALTISPTANSTNQALNITQSSPTSGSATGPFSYNLINVNNQVSVTTAGTDAGLLANTNVAGFRVNVTTGGTNVQAQTNSSGIFTVLNTVAGATSSGDIVGVLGYAYNNVAHSSHGTFGMNAAAVVGPSGTENLQIGLESDLVTFTGGTSVYRVGFNSMSGGQVNGSTMDAAFMASSNSATTKWKHLIALSNVYANTPLDTTGDLIFSDTSFTIANGINLPNATVTGNIFSFPHVTWAGAGNLQVNKTSAAISANATVPNTTVADFVNVDGSPARVAVRRFGAGGNPGFFSYTAGGTGAAPTQTLSGDGLMVMSGVGYSAADTAYNTGGGAGVFALATEDFDATHGGTKLQVITTPSGTKAQGAGATFWGSFGLSVGSSGTDPGANSISALGSIKALGATGGIGYATGAGGAVTQITSRTTGVTLNTVSGAITLFAAAPAVGTWVSCTVTNSAVAATDTVSVSVKSGTNTYTALVTAVAAGSFQISFTSIVGTASDSPVINFNVIKGVTS